jgi:hypothetical protein
MQMHIPTPEHLKPKPTTSRAQQGLPVNPKKKPNPRQHRKEQRQKDRQDIERQAMEERHRLEREEMEMRLQYERNHARINAANRRRAQIPDLREYPQQPADNYNIDDTTRYVLDKIFQRQ